MNEPGHHRTRGRDPFARGSFGDERSRPEPPGREPAPQSPEGAPSGREPRHGAALGQEAPGSGPYLAAPSGDDLYGGDPYGGDPYGGDRYGGDRYDTDPYGTGPDAGDPYQGIGSASDISPGAAAAGDPYEQELRSRQLDRYESYRRGSYQPEPPGREPRGRRAGQPRRRLRRYAMLGTGAGVAALAGGVIVVLPHRFAAPIADHCFVSCATPGAAVSVGPEPVASPGESSGTRAVRIPKPSHSPTRKPQSKAKPASVTASPRSSSPAPATPARPDFTVSYHDSPHLLGGFTGTFTITNQGSTALSGWTLTAVFPGDGFSSASGANASSSGDTITWTSPPDIGPGASLQVSFDGYGRSNSPASCTFDGYSC